MTQKSTLEYIAYFCLKVHLSLLESHVEQRIMYTIYYIQVYRK